MAGTYTTTNIKDNATVAREKMEKGRIDWLPVVDNSGRFMGGVSMSDVTADDIKMVKDIISPSEATSDVNTVLNEALSLMLSSGLKTLPVVGEDNRLAGILTFDAIQEALHEAVKTGGTK